ncbi:hypothetical protein [Kitasatospora sp. KL5]|uniref:hypothetical protein n=1 Tax=Kitasatospora sp. KL5 TaxID=3425125 RepID=UPI003D6E0C7E
MGLLLLLVSLAGFAYAVVLAVKGLVRTLGSVRRSGTVQLLRALAVVAASGAVVAYAYGLGQVGLDAMDADSGGADSAPPWPCRGVGMEKAREVDDYRVGFVPLRFMCHRRSGTVYTTSTVSAWVNPAAAVFGTAAAGLAVGARALAERSARRTAGDAVAAEKV